MTGGGVWAGARGGTPPAVATFDVSAQKDRDAGTWVVSVGGDLDIAAVPDVHRAVLEAERDGSERLALDLSDVVHLDSSGLRVLLDAAGRARREGRRLVVVAPPDGPVGRLLELTLLADHLDVVRDLDAALA
jgi:anti-sigma B factor antagonist